MSSTHSAAISICRPGGDWRGWLLIFTALVLGMWWNLAIDAVLKPAIVAVIYGWLAWLMAQPERWRALADGGDGSVKLQPVH